MDHEMPDAKWLNETNVKAALQDTSLEIETVDRALIRRYTQMFRFGHFERPYDPGEIDAQAHGAISRSIGSQVAVLLRNEGGLLPLDADYDAGHEQLMRQLPDAWDAEDLAELHRLMKLLGQTVCTAHAPACGDCPLRDLCPRCGV